MNGPKHSNSKARLMQYSLTFPRLLIACPIVKCWPTEVTMVYCVRWKHGAESKQSLLFCSEYLRGLPWGHCSLLCIKDLLFGIFFMCKHIYKNEEDNNSRNQLKTSHNIENQDNQLIKNYPLVFTRQKSRCGR